MAEIKIWFALSVFVQLLITFQVQMKILLGKIFVELMSLKKYIWIESIVL